MKLWTDTIGTGSRTAALVHGITGDHGTWLEFAPWLADFGYTVTLVDQRGHGKSPRAASYTSADLAGDLIDTLPEGMDVIIGHSLGGRSLSMAVDTLLPKRAIYLDPAWIVDGGGQIPRPMRPDGTLMAFEELAPLVPHRSEAHVRQMLSSNALFDPRVLETPNFPLASFSPAAGQPAVPSLVVLADPSALVPPDLEQRLECDGYEIRVVPGGTHDLHIDHLAATKRAVQDWVE